VFFLFIFSVAVSRKRKKVPTNSTTEIQLYSCSFVLDEEGHELITLRIGGFPVAKAQLL